jgi:hypothetical protein
LVQCLNGTRSSLEHFNESSAYWLAFPRFGSLDRPIVEYLLFVLGKCPCACMAVVQNCFVNADDEAFFVDVGL